MNFRGELSKFIPDGFSGERNELQGKVWRGFVCSHLFLNSAKRFFLVMKIGGGKRGQTFEVGQYKCDSCIKL